MFEQVLVFLPLGVDTEQIFGFLEFLVHQRHGANAVGLRS